MYAKKLGSRGGQVFFSVRGVGGKMIRGGGGQKVDGETVGALPKYTCEMAREVYK